MLVSALDFVGPRKMLLKKVISATAKVAVVTVFLVATIFYGFHAFAYAKAYFIRSTVLSGDKDQKILNLAKWAANYWDYPDGLTLPGFYRKYLPSFLHPHRGAANLVWGRGWCNQLVAATEFVFSDQYEILQHDIAFESAGHSAISIKHDNNWIFIDPFKGYVFR